MWLETLVWVGPDMEKKNSSNPCTVGLICPLDYMPQIKDWTIQSGPTFLPGFAKHH